jgi:hypothetical protein
VIRRFRSRGGFSGGSPHEPWFRIGTLEVTTTWFVVLLSIAGILVFAVTGAGSTTELNLTLWPGTWGGSPKPWTILTWPFAYPSFGLFDAFSIFIFWYFGTDLERDLFGRNRFAWLLLSFTVTLGVLLVLVDAVDSNGFTPLYGLGLLELMVALLWIAESPNRPFFFNVPAWVVGVIIVAIDVIQYLGNRQWDILLTLLLGIVVCGFIARQFGALNEYAWIPRLTGGRRRRRKLKSVPNQAPLTYRAPTESKWNPTPTYIPSKDEQRMNELLEKIHDHGTESLSPTERTELEELRLRRRRP